MRLLLRVAGLVGVLAILFLGVGLWNATRPPVIVRASLPLDGLPPGTRLKVLLISDTHFSHPDMGTGRLLSIAAAANAQQPDLILLAGDYIGGKLIDWPKVRLEQALPPLAALKAPLGVYAVMGNHDEPRWTPRIMALQVRPKLLVNSHVDLGPVVLAGLDSMRHASDYEQAIAGAPVGKPLLLLLHEPELLARLALPPNPAVLALAGHTHGGQIVLPLIGRPGALLLGRDQCWRGLCSINQWPVYVTSGLGTTFVPLRYGVPPEIVVLTLYSTGRKSGTLR